MAKKRSRTLEETGTKKKKKNWITKKSDDEDDEDDEDKEGLGSLFDEDAMEEDVTQWIKKKN